MKRLLLAAAGLAGSFLFLLSPASAQPVESVPTSVSAVVPASGSPPEAVLAVALTPSLPRVTVVSGDTLWALGIKFNRGWSALAAYNHVVNPDLIYVGQVITIPPASFTQSAPVMQSAPVHAKYTYAVANGQVSTPVSHTATYHVPVYGGAPGSFQACVMFRESTNGAGSSNLYGILPSTWASLGLGGSPYSASRSQQDAAFNELYARDGAQPWRPYDGC